MCKDWKSKSGTENLENKDNINMKNRATTKKVKPKCRWNKKKRGLAENNY